MRFGQQSRNKCFKQLKLVTSCTPLQKDDNFSILEIQSLCNLPTADSAWTSSAEIRLSSW
uniref:Uncharacterized protein n=1 Tax=Arundo donax TaxID=35708 RepID=A0A0A8Z988_ARUDO